MRAGRKVSREAVGVLAAGTKGEVSRGAALGKGCGCLWYFFCYMKTPLERLTPGSQLSRWLAQPGARPI